MTMDQRVLVDVDRSGSSEIVPRGGRADGLAAVLVAQKQPDAAAAGFRDMKKKQRLAVLGRKRPHFSSYDAGGSRPLQNISANVDKPFDIDCDVVRLGRSLR